MNKVEVDPKLFITCRLCLDEMGQYQIVPEVQKQIKYCFDIDANPFDGLPQLICKKCESILSQFYDVKTKFLQKQTALLSNSSKNDNTSLDPQQDTVTSTQQSDAEKSAPTSNSLTIKLKRDENLSLTDKDHLAESSETNNYSIIQKSESKAKPKKVSKDWRKNYNRYFACRLCSRTHKDKKRLQNHLENHKKLIVNYPYALRHCSVQIKKLDQEQNITGQTDTVVFQNDRIIQNKGGANYHILYEHKNSNHEIYSSDSSEGIVGQKRKRIRLMSSSSEATVSIEDSGKKNPDDNTVRASTSHVSSVFFENIDVNDSSSSESRTSITKIYSKKSAGSRSSVAVKSIINQISSACRKKTIRDHESRNKNAKSKDAILQRKILSLGRKIVTSKSEFNCTGILRYIEHKQLDVELIERYCYSRESENSIRIHSKLRETSTNDLDTSEWNSFGSIISVKQYLRRFLKSYIRRSSNEIDTNVTTIEIQKAANYEPANTKLLNSTPVANPKQLPKKSNLNEPSTSTALIQSSELNTYETTGDDQFMSLPKITTTMSLAPSANKKSDISNVSITDEVTVDSKKVSTFVPLIKVKPVSQLMPVRCESGRSERSLNLIPPNWHSEIDQEAHNNRNNSAPNSTNMYFNESSALPNDNERQSLGQHSHSNNPVIAHAFVLMHTVELPHTKTKSPFKYLKMLLEIHGIILMEFNEMIDDRLYCLIKFKSMFKQAQKSKITLSSALYGDEKRICFKIRDNTLKEIDLETLSPHWQWEIIKLYKGDIVEKLIYNANKISAAMLKTTNRFISLLKSIVFENIINSVPHLN
ncbi:uncharacterized protein LOC126971355 [Leptidea sinapis]|nr:uncharacterized protein LOC126971355 [Leptidea sinapis]